MRLSWITQMDLKSNDKYLYKRQREDTQKRGVTENEAETGSDGDTKMAHNHWKPEEVRKPSPFEPPQESVALPDTSILVFWLQKCEKLHFCCFKPPSLFKSEKAMAPHSNTLAWRIPWMEEPGRLQSMVWRRVGHDWATSLSCIGEGNGNPLQCSCLENPKDRGAWWAAVYGVAERWTRLKRLSSSSSSLFNCYEKAQKLIQAPSPS